MLQGPRIDCQSEGTKIVLYLVSPGRPSMMNARGISYFGSLGLKKMHF